MNHVAAKDNINDDKNLGQLESTERKETSDMRDTQIQQVPKKKLIKHKNLSAVVRLESRNDKMKISKYIKADKTWKDETFEA